MKTAEELNALKEEVETLNKKLMELSDEELKEVVGGARPDPGEIEGEVIGILPNARYEVKLDMGRGVIEAYLSGSLRGAGIILIAGDKVRVELSAYNEKKGRIVWLNKQ